MTAKLVTWIMGGLAAGSTAVMGCLAAGDASPKWVAVWGGLAALFGYLAKSPISPPEPPR